MKFQFLPENFSRSENAPPFETRKIRHFEVERIFLENKKMVEYISFPNRDIIFSLSPLQVTSSGGEVHLPYPEYPSSL